MSSFGSNSRNFASGVSNPFSSYRGYHTATMGLRFIGLFCVTTWLSLTWSLVEGTVPTCQSLTAACMTYGLDCQQRLPACFMHIQVHCQYLLDNPQETCSSNCDTALSTLVGLPVSGWLTCDCTGMSFFNTRESQCLDIQNNLAGCPSYPTPVTSTVNTVVRTPGHLAPPTTRPPMSTCTDAKTACDEVASCQAALMNVMTVCDITTSNVDDVNECSMACVKAMSKLEEQQADELWGCDCPEYGGIARGDSPMSVPWCYIFSDVFLEKCMSTEEHHVTYGPLSSPHESNRADSQVGDSRGSGTQSPRLSFPQRWLYLLITFVLAIILGSNQGKL